MAKFNHGIFSKAKNKLGGVTFQQYEGMQIGKEYQPNVKNPQTTKQVQNRAKFKVSSGFTALWFAILQYLNFGTAYDRFKRGIIVRLSVARTVVSDLTNTASVSISDALADIERGRTTSNKSVTFVRQGTGALTQFKLTADSNIESGIGIGKVVAYDEFGNVLSSRITQYEMTSSAELTLMPPAIPQGATAAYMNAMGLFLEATSAEGRALYGQMLAGGSTAVNSSLSVAVSRAVAAGDMLVTNVAYDFIDIA